MIFRLNPEKANEGRGCVVPPFVISVDAGIQGDDSLFWRGVNAPKKAELVVAWILAFASMTFPPPVMPAPDRASRTKSPYFSEASTPIKAELVVSWILAFARMTAGEALPVVGSFVGGDVPPVVMPFPVGHPGQRVLIFVGR